MRFNLKNDYELRCSQCSLNLIQKHYYPITMFLIALTLTKLRFLIFIELGLHDLKVKNLVVKNQKLTQT